MNIFLLNEVIGKFYFSLHMRDRKGYLKMKKGQITTQKWTYQTLAAHGLRKETKTRIKIYYYQHLFAASLSKPVKKPLKQVL